MLTQKFKEIFGEEHPSKRSKKDDSPDAATPRRGAARSFSYKTPKKKANSKRGKSH